MTEADTIRARIDTLSRHRRLYAMVNALLKAGDTTGLRAVGYTDAQIARLQEPDAKGRIGYNAEAVKHRIDRAKRKLRKAS